MRQFRRVIWNALEYDYEAAYGFVPNIRAYMHEDGKDHDCILVLPGGGYCICAPHEGQEVALEFYEMGMDAFVLTYSTDITMSVPLKDQPLKDISRAVRLIRKEYATPGKLIVCGFSASGHICGSLAVHYKDVKDDDPGYEAVSNRPDGVILSYPVISSGKYGHASSFEALLGKNPTDEELEYYSVEKNVSTDTPPCFIWQTATDELVPVENSYLFAEALKEKGIPYAHYVFPCGLHGLGLAKESSYKKGQDIIPDPYYSMEQVELAAAAVKAGCGVNISEKRYSELMEQFGEPLASTENPHDLTEVRNDAGLWAQLAKVWIDRL
ncbi:MAG: alpha/beta hydrolase [Lachnospiraceae bacterium]|nr:alpha/beta hydrolase [Lachnospiraceae bacterium]